MISQLILKVAQRCNLNCSYCYMYKHADQTYMRKPPFMTAEIINAFLRRAKAYLRRDSALRMTLVLHGGEPTLLPAPLMSRLIDLAREELGSGLAGISIQTNGTLITPEWAALFRDKCIDVGVSIDGLPQIHDELRPWRSGKGSFSDTMRGVNLLKEAGVVPQCICVVALGQSGAQTYHYLRNLGFKRIRYLLPDVTHDSKLFRYPIASRGTPAADFLIEVFDAWWAEDEPQVRVMPFAEMASNIIMETSYTGPSCGDTTSYLVVDTDGEIQLDDVFKICDSSLNATKLNVLKDDFDSLLFSSPVLQQLTSGKLPLADECRRCAEVVPCGGGFIAHRFSSKNGFINPSAWCQDLKKLSRHIRVKLKS